MPPPSSATHHSAARKEEVEIERNIDLPYLTKEKVIGCFNILSNNKKAFGLLLDDI